MRFLCRFAPYFIFAETSPLALALDLLLVEQTNDNAQPIDGSRAGGRSKRRLCLRHLVCVHAGAQEQAAQPANAVPAARGAHAASERGTAASAPFPSLPASRKQRRKLKGPVLRLPSELQTLQRFAIPALLPGTSMALQMWRAETAGICFCHSPRSALLPPPTLLRSAAPGRAFDAAAYHKRYVALELSYLGWTYHGFAAQAETDNTIEVGRRSSWTP